VPVDAVPGTLGPRPTDASRRAEIARIRRRATGLLVIAAVTFIVARLLEPRWSWLGFVRATAEAALVGGLADWFAVTALFRQPLGLPIPHTAIIRRQKDRIARVLGTFVQQHFLTREVIVRRLRALEPARRIGAWLADPAASRGLAMQLSTGVVRGIDTLPVERWRGSLVEEGVRVLTRAVQGGGSGIGETLREQIRLGAPRWVPGAVQEALHRRLMTGLGRFLDEVSSDPAHPARERLDRALEEAIDRFRHSVEASAEVSADEQGAGAPAQVARVLQALGTHLVSDEEARRAVDDQVAEAAAALVDAHGAEVAVLIEETVAGWDPGLAAERIELAVGRDLQYIRFNGTLVGGLAGLALYSLGLLL
jgi:uncharacterized membrane-anchored protein YjiN (DUF445 family)